jgi:cytochrome P450 family 619
MESMVIKEHTKVVDAEAVQMCRDFLIAPGDHMLHPRRYGNSITMSLGKSIPLGVSIRG